MDSKEEASTSYQPIPQDIVHKYCTLFVLYRHKQQLATEDPKVECTMGLVEHIRCVGLPNETILTELIYCMHLHFGSSQ